jgi:hypothetical protein
MSAPRFFTVVDGFEPFRCIGNPVRQGMRVDRCGHLRADVAEHTRDGSDSSPSASSIEPVVCRQSCRLDAGRFCKSPPAGISHFVIKNVFRKVIFSVKILLMNSLLKGELTCSTFEQPTSLVVG